MADKIIVNSEDFKKELKSKFVIYESALIFETGSYKKNDLNILVTCDEFERVKRVMLRDKCSEDVVRKKMKFQWKDKMKKQAKLEQMKTDEHLFSKFRCNGTLMNSELFIKTFDINKEDGMFNKNPTYIW